jgi:ubiquitin carboxyl-terminal hydrolase 5/13
MRRFTVGDDWVPKKLDVDVHVPDVLDLEWMRSSGQKPGETLLPEEKEEQTPVANKEPEFQLDMSIVENLVSMGFDPEGCKRAVYNTKNAGIEPAMNWVLEHMEDADFTSPFVIPSSSSSSSKKEEETYSEESIMMLESMGFSKSQAMKALKSTNHNLERAADWLFSRAGEVEMEVEMVDGPQQPEASGNTSNDMEVDDGGNSKYKLKAFISHMGSNTHCGHYVAHIKKNNEWVMFNDSKVSLSQDPPKEMGYLYIFERTDQSP